MSISVSGDQSQVPPGFRFHPTEEELLQYYLRKRVDLHRIDFDVIQDVDLNKLEPWDIQEKCKIGSTPQNEWYFFSHKDKKYPTGTRTNRATAAGFWKATGRDKVICSSSRPIGRRKTLVFYNGRAPKGQKSDWIMHEYRLDTDDYNTKPPVNNNNIAASLMEEGSTQEEGWVVCRIFKKKNHRTINITTTTSSYDRKLMLNYSESSVVDGTNFEQIVDRFIQLPGLESPDRSSSCGPSFNINHRCRQDWATLDRMVASHLNGEEDHHQTKTDDFTSFCSPLTTTNSMDANIIINDDVSRLQLQQQIKNTPSSSSNVHYNADSDKLDYNHNHVSCDLWSCLMRSSSSLLCNFPNEPRI